VYLSLKICLIFKHDVQYLKHTHAPKVGAVGAENVDTTRNKHHIIEILIYDEQNLKE
jgi:hypothetical protein